MSNLSSWKFEIKYLSQTTVIYSQRSVAVFWDTRYISDLDTLNPDGCLTKTVSSEWQNALMQKIRLLFRKSLTAATNTKWNVKNMTKSTASWSSLASRQLMPLNYLHTWHRVEWIIFLWIIDASLAFLTDGSEEVNICSCRSRHRPKNEIENIIWHFYDAMFLRTEHFLTLAVELFMLR